MKSHTKNVFLMIVLIVGPGLLLAGRVTAQTFTTLHNFSRASDGANPYAGLILSSNVLYGTTHAGGSSGNGTLFAINTDGTGFTNLHPFTATSGPAPATNSDGAGSEAGLILSGNTLYGTTKTGGTSGSGTVFAVNTNGTGFTTLYNFSPIPPYPGLTNSDGGNPTAELILSGNTLYGTASAGGTSGNGTVFALHTNGAGFTNLHNFTAISDSFPYGNNDGANPPAVMILSGNALYGTAANGGVSGDGALFAVSTNGTGFRTVYSFTALDNDTGLTNSDGANPYAGLILSTNTLYGSAYYGGAFGFGTVFAVKTNGTGIKTLHHFSDDDGSYPGAGLILSSNTLYGTTSTGGGSDFGTVFAVNTDGTGFTNLHEFAVGEGKFPEAGLILSGGTLYGTTSAGGSSGDGTVFSISLATVSPPRPILTITQAGTNVILTWPTNATGFTLQSTTNFDLPTAWSTNSPGPVVVNGQNTVTNPISGAQQFYRLIY